MAYKNKKQIEKEWVDRCIEKGGVKSFISLAEGRSVYYRIILNNDKILYFKDLSVESLKKLGIYDEREG